MFSSIHMITPKIFRLFWNQTKNPFGKFTRKFVNAKMFKLRQFASQISWLLEYLKSIQNSAERHVRFVIINTVISDIFIINIYC